MFSQWTFYSYKISQCCTIDMLKLWHQGKGTQGKVWGPGMGKRDKAV